MRPLWLTLLALMLPLPPPPLLLSLLLLLLLVLVQVMLHMWQLLVMQPLPQLKLPWLLLAPGLRLSLLTRLMLVISSTRWPQLLPWLQLLHRPLQQMLITGQRPQVLKLEQLLLWLLQQQPLLLLLPSRGRGSLRGQRGQLRLEAAQLGCPLVESSLKADDVLFCKKRGQATSTGSPASRVISRVRSPHLWNEHRDTEAREFAARRPVSSQAELLSQTSRTMTTQKQLLCHQQNTRRSSSLGTATAGSCHEPTALSPIAEVSRARGCRELH